MKNLIAELFSRKDLNLVVGLLTLLIFLWLIMFAIPGLFYYMFDTILGNLILMTCVVLSGIYNVKLALGLGVIFVILFRFSNMSSPSVGLFSQLKKML